MDLDPLMDLLCVVQDYDPGTAKGLRQLLAMSAEELGYCGFDFANAGGSSDVDVTVENREECVLSGERLEHCTSPFLLCGCTPALLSSPPPPPPLSRYVSKRCHYLLIKSRERHLGALKRGFGCMPAVHAVLSMFSAQELAGLVLGVQDVHPEDIVPLLKVRGGGTRV